MRKKIKLVIIAIILSLLSFKQIAYCHESLIEKSNNIIVTFAIDPSAEKADKQPTKN